MPEDARTESRPDPEELRRAQEDRERSERRLHEEADDTGQEHEAERRAEKAAYLKEKLDEQAAEDRKAD